jgi:hypothetical protein
MSGLKVLAVISALSLGGGYVWLSQRKSENHSEEIESRSVLPGSKSKVIVDEPQPFDGKFPPFDETKDEATPADSRTNADFISPEEGGSRTVLPGSKSALLLPSETDEKKPETRRRTVLPGSKSIGRVLEAPGTEKKEEKDP